MRLEKVHRHVETATAKVSGQECREADDEPFSNVERLKQNFLHQFECVLEWLDDLDLGRGSVHITI